MTSPVLLPRQKSSQRWLQSLRRKIKQPSDSAVKMPASSCLAREVHQQIGTNIDLPVCLGIFPFIAVLPRSFFTVALSEQSPLLPQPYLKLPNSR